MTDIKEKKRQRAHSSEDYGHLDKKIVKGGNTFAEVKHKTKEELVREMKAKEEKKEMISGQQENIQKFWKALFLNLKDTLDNSKIANNYLFELIKDHIEDKESYNGLYKVDVIKVNPENIICRIRWGENHKHDITITNEEIMKKKTKTHMKRIKNEKGERIEQPTQFEDKLEEGFVITKTYHTPDGKKHEKTRPGRREDFLMEIQYGDSVIIDIQKDNIKKIEPDDIIEEIRKYIKNNDNQHTRNKKIQTAMKFFNESTEQNSSEYIQDFFKLVRSRESKRNKGKPVNEIENYKQHFGEILKKYFNNQQLYVHKWNDIDKSAVKFLLEKFGIKADKVFKEIDHSEVESMDSWVFLDVWGTVNGMKTTKTPIPWTKKWQKTKTIFSEHTDASDEALLANRPSSTTQMIFKMFKELGAIDKEQLPQIQRFVNFVNTVDTMDYQISGIDYKHNYQTLFGLYRTMDIKDIFDYFANPDHNGFEKLPERYMKKTKTIIDNGGENKKTLQEVSAKNKDRTEKDINNFEKIKKAGRELTYKGKKFIVDIEEKPENQIQYGPQTAGYYEYGFFNIKPGRWNLYIYSPKKFPPMIEWFTTDGNFLIINNPTVEEIEELFKDFSTKDEELKNKIIDRLKTIQRKNAEPATQEEIISRCKILPEHKKEDFKVGETFPAIIHDNIQGKIAYLTLDKNRIFKSRVKVKNKNELKNYIKWDLIRVKVDAISEDETKPFILSLVETKA